MQTKVKQKWKTKQKQRSQIEEKVKNSSNFVSIYSKVLFTNPKNFCVNKHETQIKTNEKQKKNKEVRLKN